MKYAPIIPRPLIDAFQESGKSLIRVAGGYLFALGQEVLRDQVYKQHIEQARTAGAFLIVDNGAAENDTPPFEEIVNTLGPDGFDEIILPDVLYDPDETAARTCAAARLVPPLKRMVVPQAEASWDEWIECFNAIRDILGSSGFASVGIAKHLERLPGGRRSILDYLQRRGLHRRYHIHALGIWQHPTTETAMLSTYPWLRGMDSGCAVAYAQNGYGVEADTPRFSLDWNRPADLSLVERNINYMRCLASGEVEYDTQTPSCVV